ncbi:MAG: vitamin B12 dependent-methionine synthase activation domain-containing protein, partial [Leptothrix sp. (in: b-proteobacteria)]
WDLAGKFPDILKDEVVGAEAVRVFSDGKRMLQRIIDGRWLQAHGVIQLLPANTVDDDVIEVYADEGRSEVLLRWQPLRMQSERPVIDGQKRPNRSLADFIAPKGTRADHIGLFAVTAGLGVDKKEAQFIADLDDYSAIMLKALADRLAEAFAEHLHQRVRAELWGYAAGEALTNEQLIAEQYRGIRPAPGYPACPDHLIKRAMFEVLDARDIGMGLTDSMAMTPAASVSGFYLAHPESDYFNVGKIGDDQLRDFAQRHALSEADARRALAPQLG